MSLHRFEVAGGIHELQYAMKMFRCGFRTLGDIRVESIINIDYRAGYCCE